LEKNTKLERLKQEESKERIILRNGGGIYCISAQSSRMKKSIEAAMGEGSDDAIIDEAGLINDESEATIFRMIAGKEDGFSFELSESDDTLAAGEYLEGDREGSWVFRQGEQIIRGRFVAGLMDGEWKHTFPNGNTAFVGTFRNGKAEGRHQAFRSEGRLYWEGKYQDGKRIGYWRSYDLDGIIYLTVEYRDGVEIGYEGVKIKPEFEPADYEYLLQESTIKF
jgi:antitoxin component YwqK of YwqJK toxin-antitoxin module